MVNQDQLIKDQLITAFHFDDLQWERAILSSDYGELAELTRALARIAGIPFDKLAAADILRIVELADKIKAIVDRVAPFAFERLNDARDRLNEIEQRLIEYDIEQED